MRHYGNNGLRSLPSPSPYYPDCADVQNSVLPGYRIRNKKQKRRFEKKVTRQSTIRDLRKLTYEYKPKV